MGGSGESGLDVVILVDVSYSMYGTDRKSGLADGSDPERMRWDAVKLVTDFLTDEDRVLILPFNDQSPASYRDHPIPSVFPRRFQSLRQPRIREELETEIFKSIHNDLKLDGIYADEGGTSILGALKTARLAMQEDRNRIGRLNRQVAILLTDGKEDVKGLPDPEELADLFQSEADAFRDEGVRVFTIGLGDEVDAQRLQFLSRVTGGSYLHAKTNESLIVFFRDLIWSLKGNWIWRTEQFELQEGRHKIISSRPLRGVTDLGVLCYQIHKDARPPRTTFAPSPLPKLIWQEKKPSMRDPDVLLRSGKNIDGQTTGYSYYYCDGRETFDAPRGAVFQENGALQLALEFEKTDGPTSVFVVKRVKPAFQLELAGSRFFRHQPIPVHVRLEPPGAFSREDFEVVASLRRPDGKGEARTVELFANGGGDQLVFAVEKQPLTAESLLSDGGDADSYVVSVTIRGREDRGHALSGFEFELPPRMIEIQNVIPLRHRPNEILLSRRNRQQLVDLEAIFPNTVGDISVRLRQQGDLQTSAGDRIEGVRFEFPQDIVLKNGKSQFPVAMTTTLPPSRKIDATVNLIASAAPDSVVGVAPESSQNTEYPIPIRVVLDDVKLVVTPRQVKLSVGSERSQASIPVTVELSSADESGRDVDSLVVEIEQSDDGPTFSPDELWIQLDGDPVHVDERAQEVSLSKPGVPLQIYYQPRPRKNIVGTHKCLLVAKATGLSKSESLLELDVGRPKIVLRDRNAGKGMRAVPGALTTVHYKARMLWLRDGVWTFTAESGGREGSAFEFSRSTDASSGETTSFVAMLRSSSEFQFTSAEGLTENDWTDLTLTFAIPKTAKEGSYVHEVALRNAQVQYERLLIELNIRPLQIEFRPTVSTLQASRENRFAVTTPFAVALVNPNESTVGTGELTVELKPGDENAESFGADELWIQTTADPLPESDRSRSLVLERVETPMWAFFHPKAATALELSEVPLRFELTCEGYGFSTARGALDGVLAAPAFEFVNDPAAIHTFRSSESAVLVSGFRVHWIPGSHLNLLPVPQVRFLPRHAPVFADSAPFDVVFNADEVDVQAVDPRGAEPPFHALKLPMMLPGAKQMGRYDGSLEFRHAGRSYASLPMELFVNELIPAYPVFSEQVQAIFGSTPSPDETKTINVYQFLDHGASHTLVVRNPLLQPLDLKNLVVQFEKTNSKGTPLLYRSSGDVVRGPEIRKSASATPSAILVTLVFPRVSHGETEGPYSGQLVVKYEKETEQGKIDYGQVALKVDLHLVDLRSVQVK